jgi:general secretion pathway protein M
VRWEALRRTWVDCGSFERALLVCGAGLVGLALMGGAVVGPAVSSIARLQRDLPVVCEQSARLRTLLDEVRGLKSRPTIVIAADPRAALDQSLGAAGLKATRVAGPINGAWQLSFADVPYGAWSVWLAGSERALGLRVIAVSAKATATPGNADVQVELRSERER